MSGTTMEAVQNAASERRLLRNPLNPPIESLARRFGGSNSKELERFLKFAIVGISGAILDLGTLAILQATILPPATAYDPAVNTVIGVDPSVAFATPLPFYVALATTIAFIVAVLNNFVWTSTWVYPEEKSTSLRRKLAQFAFISLIGWSARTAWITTMYIYLGHFMTPPLTQLIQLFQPAFEATPVIEKQLGTIVAQLIAMWFVMIWNFFANRHWTFSEID